LIRKRVTKQVLLRVLERAAEDMDGFRELSTFIYDPLVRDDDIEYDFDSAETEDIFGLVRVFVTYVCGGEPDSSHLVDIQRVVNIIKCEDEWDVQHVILGLEFEEIAELVRRYEAGAISLSILEEQVDKIYSTYGHAKKILALYKRWRTMCDER